MEDSLGVGASTSGWPGSAIKASHQDLVVWVGIATLDLGHGRASMRQMRAAQCRYVQSRARGSLAHSCAQSLAEGLPLFFDAEVEGAGIRYVFCKPSTWHLVCAAGEMSVRCSPSPVFGAATSGPVKGTGQRSTSRSRVSHHHAEQTVSEHRSRQNASLCLRARKNSRRGSPARPTSHSHGRRNSPPGPIREMQEGFKSKICWPPPREPLESKPGECQRFARPVRWAPWWVLALVSRMTMERSAVAFEPKLFILMRRNRCLGRIFPLTPGHLRTLLELFRCG